MLALRGAERHNDRLRDFTAGIVSEPQPTFKPLGELVRLVQREDEQDVDYAAGQSAPP
jgi:hypothetical protein